jgi:superfamily II DNA helicase RecQ
VLAQKILSCIARAEERLGVEHVADVLIGAENDRVRAGATTSFPRTRC